MTDRRKDRRSYWWIAAIVAVAVAIASGAAAVWTLIDPLATSDSGDRAAAVQATFTVAFGIGGLATLALFTRRQWLQERVHEHTQYDAEQRRITEQYMQAVEQLGHDKAPVRLGGLYALERLGLEHPEQRQVVAEVWCAYLRRQYTPPVRILNSTNEVDLDGQVAEEPDESAGERAAEASEEYEVRMTAQRLLAEHLRDPRPDEERNGTRPVESRQFWHLDQLNLAGAVLISADFTDCSLPELKAEGAHFHGRTSFVRAHFEGYTAFFKAHFERDAEFVGAHFEGYTGFGKAHFERRAWFAYAHFEGYAEFVGAHFESDAAFGNAHFERDAWFVGAHFESDAAFGNAHFEGDTTFGNAHFERDAWFVGAHFESDAAFGNAHFEGPAWFGKAHSGGSTGFSQTETGNAEVATIPAEPEFDFSEVVVYQVEFDLEIHPIGHHRWPLGWAEKPDGDRWTLVRVERDDSSRHEEGAGDGSRSA
ncbi:pentapeptide repeat-containing protein [Glycomyces halotolerans]